MGFALSAAKKHSGARMEDAQNRETAKSDRLMIGAYLGFAHLAAICIGVDAATHANTSLFTLIASLAIGVALTLACRTDARRRGHPIGHAVQLIILFTWKLTAPLYLLWSRGLRGVLWAILWSVSILICLWVGMFVAEVVQPT